MFIYDSLLLEKSCSTHYMTFGDFIYIFRVIGMKTLLIIEYIIIFSILTHFQEWIMYKRTD